MVRHAKAESGGFDNDFNRKLHPRGEADAIQLAQQLNALGVVPNRIISSSANRAISTARIYSEHLNFPSENIELWSEYYEGVTTQDLIDKLQESPNSIDVICIFGHNPTVHYLVHNMCSNFNHDTPTCATAIIDFKANSWQDIKAREGNITHHLTPKASF